MTFRPYPVLTLLTLAALGVLIWLGSWQLDRRAWKIGLIAEFETVGDAPAIGLDEAFCEDGAQAGRAIDAPARRGGATLRVYGRNDAGAPGWRIFSQLPLPDCAGADIVLAETRFEPLETAGGAGMQASRPETVERVRLERPPASGAFTPPPSDGFYAFDREAMAQALQIAPHALAADWWLARDTGEPPAHLTQTPPERHAAYALTWFLTAIALVGVWLAFHLKAGRLKL
ncbi:MAG: SURF1 family protein [Oceanicaulis sp.]